MLNNYTALKSGIAALAGMFYTTFRDLFYITLMFLEAARV